MADLPCYEGDSLAGEAQPGQGALEGSQGGGKCPKIRFAKPRATNLQVLWGAFSALANQNFTFLLGPEAGLNKSFYGAGWAGEMMAY